MPGCDDILFRASPDVPDGLTAPVADLARRYRKSSRAGVLEPVSRGLARPFSDVEEALRVGGFRVDYLQVSGHGTSIANADRLVRQRARCCRSTPVLSLSSRTPRACSTCSSSSCAIRRSRARSPPASCGRRDACTAAPRGIRGCPMEPPASASLPLAGRERAPGRRSRISSATCGWAGWRTPPVWVITMPRPNRRLPQNRTACRPGCVRPCLPRLFSD